MGQANGCVLLGDWGADCGVEYLVGNRLSGALVPLGPILNIASV